MRTIYKIEDLKEFARKTHGGDCLSTSYSEKQAKYLWVDKDGRTFEKTWESILDGRWSTRKKAQRRHSYTIGDLKKFAESKGGKCLDNEFKGITSLYLWEDENGEQWKSRAHSVLNCNAWSPSSRRVKRQKARSYEISELHDFALTKGGKCLDIEYRGGNYKYTWEDSGGREFKMRWNCVVQGQWSTHENNERIKKMKTKYSIEWLKEYFSSKGWECLNDSYDGNRNNPTKLILKSPEGKIFHRYWGAIKSRGLPSQDMVSNQEKELGEFIVSLGVEVKRNVRNIIAPSELDFYIPSLNLAIEYNGCYYHHSKRHYHLDKTKKCNALGIDLIHIFDVDWNSRKEQIKSFLTAKLQKNNRKFFARKCQIADVPKSEAKEFLDQHHILGGKLAFIKAIGLYSDGELLSLITLSPHHRGLNEVVLSRFIGKTGVTVLGGLSRLTSAGKKEYGSLTTFVDLTISNGNNWIKSGWKLLGSSPPDYFYYNLKTKKKVKKQSRRKGNIGTPGEMTESEHAKLDGLVPIYDCGKLKLII